MDTLQCTIFNDKNKPGGVMEISKDQWQEYGDVQDSGEYNMYDPSARSMTSLTKHEWIHIMQNYSQLKEKYDTE